jgi:hypothetical protein
MKHLLTTLTTIFVAVALLCTFCLPAEAKQKGAICNAGEVVIGIDGMGGVICGDGSGIPPTYSYGEYCSNDDLAGCDSHADGNTGGIYNRLIIGLQCPDPGDRMIAGGCDCFPGADSSTQVDGDCRITASRPVSSIYAVGDEAWTCTLDDADEGHVYVLCADVDGDGDGDGFPPD